MTEEVFAGAIRLLLESGALSLPMVVAVALVLSFLYTALKKLPKADGKPEPEPPKMDPLVSKDGVYELKQEPTWKPGDP